MIGKSPSLRRRLARSVAEREVTRKRNSMCDVSFSVSDPAENEAAG
jgi:hypothetical protein